MPFFSWHASESIPHGLITRLHRPYKTTRRRRRIGLRQRSPAAGHGLHVFIKKTEDWLYAGIRGTQPDKVVCDFLRLAIVYQLRTPRAPQRKLSVPFYRPSVSQPTRHDFWRQLLNRLDSEFLSGTRNSPCKLPDVAASNHLWNPRESLASEHAEEAAI